MQNLKIQTLWQLCQELKQKRQDMIEKLGYTQNYIDQQQSLMSHELLSLRRHNNELSSDLAQLYSHLETLRQDMQQRGENGAEAVHALGNSEREAELAAELETLRNQYAKLEADFFELQDMPAGDDGETAQRLEQLSQDYQQLQSQLSETQDALDTKETQVGMLSQTVQVIQREFDALRTSNDQLSGDMKSLVAQTDQLIALVETYRQAALAAVSEAGLQEEAEATTISAEGDDEGDGLDADGETKAEAVREAVRKKINTLLRHRFGKVPRKLSTSIKEVSSNHRLDKLFDKALKAETLDEFEASFEA